MGTSPIPITGAKSVGQMYHVYQYERFETIVDKAKLNRHYPNYTYQQPQNPLKGVKT